MISTSTEFIEVNPTISVSYLEDILFDHSVSLAEYQAEFGVHDRYDSQTLFDWLGY